MKRVGGVRIRHEPERAGYLNHADFDYVPANDWRRPGLLRARFLAAAYAGALLLAAGTVAVLL